VNGVDEQVARVEELMRAARTCPVPASGQVLAEIPELGFELWALGGTAEEATLRLARLVAQQVTRGQRRLALKAHAQSLRREAR